MWIMANNDAEAFSERFGLYWQAESDADRRIIRLADAAYQRLPEHDRHVLRELILDVHIRSEADSELNWLGQAGDVDTDAYIDGIQAVYSEDAQIDLSQTKLAQSDAAALYIIAHEFAHVVLRHWQMSATAGNLASLDFAYPGDAMADLKSWHEDHAALQAWVWGFREEMAAFFDEFPKSPRPRWYIVAHWEAPEEGE
jgi:hypothetical protein